MNYADKLRNLRIVSGLSTSELGKRIGLSQSAISKLENGQRRIDIDTLQKICCVFNTSLVEFFSDRNDSDLLPPDLTQLVETAKKLSPEERIALTAFLQVRLNADT